MSTEPGNARQRMDKWLFFTRIAKSRTLAQGWIEAGHVTVNGDKVEGWMDAMTMKYKVDDKKVLKSVKAGDQITATVYDGDGALHNVQVVAKPAK